MRYYMDKSELNYIGTLAPHKKTVLFIPGGRITPAVYDDIRLPDDFQGAQIDWGLSPGPSDICSLGKRILLLIKEKELGPTVLVGYSQGGAIAIAAAVAGPEQIAGLFLSNTGANTRGHGDPNAPQRILQGTTRERLAAFIDSCFFYPIPPELREQAIDYACQVPLQTAYESALSLRQTDLLPHLNKFKSPVVIAHGKYDTRRNEGHVADMISGFPNAKAFFLEGGHTIMVDAREEWNRLLLSYLESIGKENVPEI